MRMPCARAAAHSAQLMAGQFDRLNRSIATAGATFTRAFGAAVGVGLVTQLPAMMARAVSSVGDLSEAAEQAGVSIRDLRSIMEALTELAPQTRDPETGAHIKRTQNYVRAIAQDSGGWVDRSGQRMNV